MRQTASRRIAAVLAAALLGSAAAAAAEGTLEKLRRTSIVTFAHDTDSLPFSFVTPQGQPDGYSVDLCERIAASLQNQLGLKSLKIEWVPQTKQNRVDLVASGKVDLECGTTTATLSRMEKVDFSALIFVDAASLLVPVGGAIRGPGDIGGKRIAVIPGTTSESRLKEILGQRMVLATLVPVRNAEEGVNAVLKGRADAYAGDRLVLEGAAARSSQGERLAVLAENYSMEPYALMLRRNDADFRLAVNRALSQIYRTGLIQEVYGRWLGPLGAPGPFLQTMYLLNAYGE